VASPAETSSPRVNGHATPFDTPYEAAPIAELTAAAPSPEVERPDATPAVRPAVTGPYSRPRPAAPVAPVASQGPRPPTDGVDLERNGCTAPQLRRFIKSRAYVPMHELRRRFAIEGGDDEVTPVDMSAGSRVFVGLPNREGRLLGELLRAGDIGYELSMDPISPIVVGVFPMRPVPRP